MPPTHTYTIKATVPCPKQDFIHRQQMTLLMKQTLYQPSHNGWTRSEHYFTHFFGLLALLFGGCLEGSFYYEIDTPISNCQLF